MRVVAVDVSRTRTRGVVLKANDCCARPRRMQRDLDFRLQVCRFIKLDTVQEVVSKFKPGWSFIKNKK